MTSPDFQLSESLEDYLEVIRDLKAEGQVARVRDIAARKGVRMPSVANALTRLAAQGLVDYRAREYVDLTPEGEQAAERVAQRHAFLERFLREVLLVSAAVAEKDACSLEHSLSPETLERIAGFYQYVKGCPHGEEHDIVADFRRCCTSGDTAAQEECLGEAHTGPTPDDLPCGLNLMGLKPGQAGRISRLRAAPDIRRRLVELGLLPGTRVELEGVAPLGDPVRLKLKGCRLCLRREEAKGIYVESEGALAP
jgi:DtxR family Mn-dependent transcriptional regulator